MNATGFICKISRLCFNWNVRHCYEGTTYIVGRCRRRRHIDIPNITITGWRRAITPDGQGLGSWGSDPPLAAGTGPLKALITGARPLIPLQQKFELSVCKMYKSTLLFENHICPWINFWGYTKVMLMKDGSHWKLLTIERKVQKL